MAKAWRWALEGEGEALPHLWSLDSFLTPRAEGPQPGGLRRWGRAGGCPALAQPLWGWCGGAGASREQPREVPVAGIQPGEVFFPGKGYSLSLGAVVIAGGGSGPNFHADALRSRRLEHV